MVSNYNEKNLLKVAKYNIADSKLVFVNLDSRWETEEYDYSKIIEATLLIPQAISNIALEGTMTPETAAEWLQEQVETLYADRQ